MPLCRKGTLLSKPTGDVPRARARAEPRRAPPHQARQGAARRGQGVALPRLLSKLGYCSRTRAAELIDAGRVAVDGVVCRNPARRVHPSHTGIAVDGQLVSAAQKGYWMLNKPRGLVTTAQDEQERATVYRCFDGANLPWIFPVGRLDRASEGLLLFTNDTVWAARILDPARQIDKTYHVQVDRLPAAEWIEPLLAGVEDRGEWLTVRALHVLRSGTRNAWLEVVLDQGRNRQIRRMLAAVGVGVLRLMRIRIGELPLGDLPKGAFRALTEAEHLALAANIVVNA